jgi:hypothetical protein
VSPYRGSHRAGYSVASSRPAPLLASELNVTGFKRANVGELVARLSFRQEAADCETYFVGFEVVRLCRTVRQRSMLLGRHDDSPRLRRPNDRRTPISAAILILQKFTPISTMRSPFNGSRPVVSVSTTISRILGTEKAHSGPRKLSDTITQPRSRGIRVALTSTACYTAGPSRRKQTAQLGWVVIRKGESLRACTKITFTIDKQIHTFGDIVQFQSPWNE